MIPVFMYVRDEEYNILQLYANYYKPSKIDLLWSIIHKSQLELLLASFNRVYSYIDEHNILRYVPDYSTRNFTMPMVDMYYHAKGPKFDIEGKTYPNAQAAITSIIGWSHPNRYNILNQVIVEEKFDINQLKYIRTQRAHNRSKVHVFSYQGEQIVGMKKLVSRFGVNPKEIKERFRLKDRHQELIEDYLLSNRMNRVHVGRGRVHNPGTLLDNASQLRKFFELEGDGIGDVMAKRILKELKVL